MPSLLLDVESTGLDTKKDRIIEFGIQVVDDNWEPTQTFSYLVKGADYPPLTADITRITKITQNDLDTLALSVQAATTMIDNICKSKEFDYVIAFNRSFDEDIVKTEMARGAFTMLPGINKLCNTPWICAMADVESNYDYKSWRLQHLALEYGVTVNPKQLHRAINDVELMRQMLVAANANPHEMYKFQQTPWVFLQALIPAPWTDNGKGVAEAKKMGYQWEVAKGTQEPRHEKCWVKRIKQHKLEDELKLTTFKTKEIR